ncbi:MAG: carbohydrate-binding protein [Oscillospiraceae bacterium]|nr:carbohydrate-binding protein [Oscillospiraceae bacterium]
MNFIKNKYTVIAGCAALILAVTAVFFAVRGSERVTADLPFSIEISRRVDGSGFLCSQNVTFNPVEVKNDMGLEFDAYFEGDMESLKASTGHLELGGGNNSVSWSPAALPFVNGEWTRITLPLSQAEGDSPKTIESLSFLIDGMPTDDTAVFRLTNSRIVDTSLPMSEDAVGGAVALTSVSDRWKLITPNAKYPTDDMVVAVRADDDPRFEQYRNTDLDMSQFLREQIDLLSNKVTNSGRLNGQTAYPAHYWDPNNNERRNFDPGSNYTGDMVGGTLYIPEGIYTVNEKIILPYGVTIRGDWKAPTDDDGPMEGTIFKTNFGKGRQPNYNENSTDALFIMLPNSMIRNIAFWYPEQNPLNIEPYFTTIHMFRGSNWGADYTHIRNVTFVNSYHAIMQGPGGNGCPNIHNIYGTPLSGGLLIDGIGDVGRFDFLHFSPEIWENSGLPGSPLTAAAKQSLRDFLWNNGVAINLRRIDWSYTCYVYVKGYKVGLALTQTPGLTNSPNGQCYDFEIVDCRTGILLERMSGGPGVLLANFKIENCYIGIESLTNVNIGNLSLSFSSIDAIEYAIYHPGGHTVSLMSTTIKSGKIVSSGGLNMTDCNLNNDAPQIILNSGGAGINLTGNRVKGQRVAPDIEIPLGMNVSVDLTPVVAGSPSSRNPEDTDIREPNHLKREDAMVRDAKPSRAVLYVGDFPQYRSTDWGNPNLDITDSLQGLLNTAANQGGGVVFIPPGHYRLNGTKSIVIPSGVELKGAVDLGRNPVQLGTIFNIYGGKDLDISSHNPNGTLKDSTDPISGYRNRYTEEEVGPANFVLQANSGIRGVVFAHPDNFDQRFVDIGPYIPSMPEFDVFTRQPRSSEVARNPQNMAPYDTRLVFQRKVRDFPRNNNLPVSEYPLTIYRRIDNNNNNSEHFVDGDNNRIWTTLTEEQAVARAKEYYEFDGTPDFPIYHVVRERVGNTDTDLLRKRSDTYRTNPLMAPLNMVAPGQEFPNGIKLALDTIRQYPYAIEGAGANVYAVNISLHNAYNGIDFAKAKCDNHYVEYLSGMAYNSLIRVGSGSKGGAINNFQMNCSSAAHGGQSKNGSWPLRYAPWESINRGFIQNSAIDEFAHENLVALKVGHVEDQILYDNFNWSGSVGLLFVEENGKSASGWSVGNAYDSTVHPMIFDTSVDMDFINNQIVPLRAKTRARYPDYRMENAFIEMTANFDQNKELRFFNNAYWGSGGESYIKVANGHAKLYNNHFQASAQIYYLVNIVGNNSTADIFGGVIRTDLTGNSGGIARGIAPPNVANLRDRVTLKSFYIGTYEGRPSIPVRIGDVNSGSYQLFPTRENFVTPSAVSKNNPRKYLGALINNIHTPAVSNVTNSNAANGPGTNGVYIEKAAPSSFAAAIGLRLYDVITLVNGRSFSSVRQFNEIIDSIPDGENVILKVWRQTVNQSPAISTPVSLPLVTAVNQYVMLSYTKGPDNEHYAMANHIMTGGSELYYAPTGNGRIADCNDREGGRQRTTNVTGTTDWMHYKLYFTEIPTSMTMRYSLSSGSRNVTFRLGSPNGPVLFTASNYPGTGSWDYYRTETVNITPQNLPLNELIDVYVSFSSDISLNWFSFNSASSPAPDRLPLPPVYGSGYPDLGQPPDPDEPLVYSINFNPSVIISPSGGNLSVSISGANLDDTDHKIETRVIPITTRSNAGVSVGGLSVNPNGNTALCNINLPNNNTGSDVYYIFMVKHGDDILGTAAIIVPAVPSDAVVRAYVNANPALNQNAVGVITNNTTTLETFNGQQVWRLTTQNHGFGIRLDQDFAGYNSREFVVEIEYYMPHVPDRPDTRLRFLYTQLGISGTSNYNLRRTAQNDPNTTTAVENQWAKWTLNLTDTEMRQGNDGNTDIRIIKLTSGNGTGTDDFVYVRAVTITPK